MHVKAKHLAYIPKVWHYFITSRLIPTMNVCEVTANVCEVTTKRALLNFAIIQDIPFDVGQVIEDAILYNRDAKLNLGHPFLIYGLCKNAGVSLEDNEVWIHPIKVIIIKKDKPGVPRSNTVYDSGHEPLDEEELTAYQTFFVMREETSGEACQPSTSHLPPPPLLAEPDVPSPSPTLEDMVQDLTFGFDAFWDGTQEHRVTISKDMDALRADMHIILRNQQLIQQQLIQQQLAQLLAFPLPPPPVDLNFIPQHLHLSFGCHTHPSFSYNTIRAFLGLVCLRASGGLVYGPLSAYVVHFRVSLWLLFFSYWHHAIGSKWGPPRV